MYLHPLQFFQIVFKTARRECEFYIDKYSFVNNILHKMILKT